MRVDATGIVIAGAGARTAVGETVTATAAAVRAGVALLEEMPDRRDRAGAPIIGARAPYLPAELTGAARLAELAIPALREAAAPLIARSTAKRAVPLIVGLPAARPGRAETIERDLAERLRRAIPEWGPFASIRTVPAGHAAGLLAMQEGCRAIASGSTEACLVGGVDSYLEPATLAWLDGQEQIHSENCPWGFGPGEGAGFCLLATEKFARAQGLDVLIRIVSVADAREPNRIKTDTVCLGKGLTEAIRSVLESIPARVHQTICDMNGEPYRAEEFGFMVTRLGERFVEASNFIAPADVWGDVGAASGPLFAILAFMAARKGYASGPLTLVWASSEGGERAAAVLSSETRGT